MSKVAIIGYGNVGYHFSEQLAKMHSVSIFSKNPSETHVKSIDELTPSDFEFAVLCLPDDAIKSFADNLVVSECIVVHTSGSRPISDLSNHPKRGVVYPLQTFTKEKIIDFNTFPIFIEGTEETEKSIFSFVRSFGTDVRLMNSASRAKLHLAAVYACNFTNHMYHISDEIMNSLGASFKDLHHLAEETLTNSAELTPKKAQTGPAARADIQTIQNHLNMIEDPEWKKIYELISQDIRKSQG